MKSTRNTCKRFAQGLCNLESLTGAVFTYAVGENKDTLISLVEGMNSAAPVKSPEFKAYEAEARELVKGFTKKDENGAPVIETVEGRKVNIVEDAKKEEAFTALEALKTKHADAITAYEAAIKEYQGYLEEEVEVPILAVELSDVPAEITEAQMYLIRPMIAKPH